MEQEGTEEAAATIATPQMVEEEENGAMDDGGDGRHAANNTAANTSAAASISTDGNDARAPSADAQNDGLNGNGSTPEAAVALSPRLDAADGWGSEQKEEEDGHANVASDSVATHHVSTSMEKVSDNGNGGAATASATAVATAAASVGGSASMTPVRSNMSTSILKSADAAPSIPEEAALRREQSSGDSEYRDEDFIFSLVERGVSFRSFTDESAMDSATTSQRSASDIDRGSLRASSTLDEDEDDEHHETQQEKEEIEAMLNKLDQQERRSFRGRQSLRQTPPRRASKYHVHDRNRRVSLTTDLETGKAGGGMRLHEAKVRSVSGCQPQNELKRRRRTFQKTFTSIKQRVMGEESDEDMDEGSLSNTSVRGRLVVSSSQIVESDANAANEKERSNRDVEYFEEKKRTKTQYTLKAKQTIASSRGPFGQHVMYEVSTLAPEEKGCGLSGVRPNRLVHSYLNWAFRETFVKVFLSAAIIFFTLTGAFALLIFASGSNKPQCIHVNGAQFGETGADFMDAYALSWTTFSTVGYGLVYPSTSSVHSDVHECTGITILATLESFVGILYASFCGAIMFAKVTRIASFAQVTFSDPIVIRFGPGIAVEDEEEEDATKKGAAANKAAINTIINGMSNNDNGDSQSGSDPTNSSNGNGSGSGNGDGSGSNGDGSNAKPNSYRSPTTSSMSRNETPLRSSSSPGGARISLSRLSQLPCPLLEFRVVNRLAGQLGGEIIDASMNIVASIDENQADAMVKTNKVRRRGGKKGKRRRRVDKRRRSSANYNAPSTRSYDRVAKSVRGMFATSVDQGRTQAIVEDPTGKVVPKRVFAKLDIDSAEHPFFKRLWLVRHVLDENSPLLKKQARELVRLNGGHWPKELNSAEGVRASVDFDQILVSLSGTSNVDANSVYAQKAYDYVDICVGYRFCNILFRNEDGTLGVDQSLLNDVTEQLGGGGEILTENAGKHHGDIFVL